MACCIVLYCKMNWLRSVALHFYCIFAMHFSVVFKVLKNNSVRGFNVQIINQSILSVS